MLKRECDKAVAAGLMETNPIAAFDAGDMSKENYAKVDLHKKLHGWDYVGFHFWKTNEARVGFD
jgi:hypothetical protein